MKGRWVSDLAIRTLERDVTVQEALRFFTARFLPKPTNFSLEGIQFRDAAHNIWAIAWEIFLARRYSPKGLEIGEGDIVVDVGAHRGIFSAYAANRTKARIISIEPNPDNFAALCKFREENQWNQIFPIFGAVAPTNGTIRLFLSPSSSRHSTTGVDPVNKDNQTSSIDVPAHTLEEILQDVPVVDLLKMDCEGAEYEVLMSSSDLLPRIRRIAMEIHFQTPGADFEGLYTFLKTFYRNIYIVRENVALGYLYAW